MPILLLVTIHFPGLIWPLTKLTTTLPPVTAIEGGLSKLTPTPIALDDFAVADNHFDYDMTTGKEVYPIAILADELKNDSV